MLCPKCKKEIELNSLRCKHCGAKIMSICKRCGAYNLITETECQNCGNILLKICKKCNSANLPEATTCRKCSAPLENDKDKGKSSIPEYYADLNSQQQAKLKLLDAVKSGNTKIITISGNSGIGKNIILRSAISELKSSKLIWLWGTCTQITQLSPFGYFQDLFLTFFNINNFCPDTLQLKKNSMKFFKHDFPILNNNEIVDLLNFLYPELTDKYENLYYNKTKMFEIMKKVLSTILDKMKIIFVIDKFEFLDGMSYDFILEIIKDEAILDKIKFIIINKENRPGIGLINSTVLSEENFENIAIAPFSEAQTEAFLKQYKDEVFEPNFIKNIYKYSNGNPAFIEQAILLKKDLRRANLQFNKYENLDIIIEQRLNLLKREDWHAYRILIAMSVLGIKFYPAILENFDNNSPQEFERIMSDLMNKGFISQLNNLTFEFKSEDVWKTIVSVVKHDEIFEEILNIIYEILSIYKHSSVALIAYIVQKLNNNDKAFDTWTLLMKHASYIGDIGLYIIAQKQCLKLIENKQSEFFIKVKKNIYTRVGKLLEPIDVNLAFDFLQKAVMMLSDNEDATYIELLGYLASCSSKLGNYYGAIECIENVLNKIDSSNDYDRALVKSKLVKPLLKLGNFGELINLAENDVLPNLEKYLSKNHAEQISMKQLFELWLGIYFDYTEALIRQGNSKRNETIQNIYSILDKNNITTPEFVCKALLLDAFSHTISGDVKYSEKILEDILKEYPLEAMDTMIISRWNYIDLLNKFHLKDYNVIQSEIFNVVAYANNINDNYTKNMLKTMLAKMLFENGQTKKALEILEEQVAYFAKEKIASGVLLSWYLIAKIKLTTNNTQFALDIIAKALDVTKGANVNNYYFLALFNKLIGEIYMAKQDFESSKVYIEKAIMLSKQFDFQHILATTYILYAKLYQELALPKSANRTDYIKKALKMFMQAKKVEIFESQPALQKEIKEELALFTSFCKLNGIVLKKES